MMFVALDQPRRQGLRQCHRQGRLAAARNAHHDQFVHPGVLELKRQLGRSILPAPAAEIEAGIASAAERGC
jgi:hypothetical protein